MPEGHSVGQSLLPKGVPVAREGSSPTVAAIETMVDSDMNMA